MTTNWKRPLLTLAACGLLSVLASSTVATGNDASKQTAQPPKAVPDRVRMGAGSVDVPLHFEESAGQVGSPARFMARAAGYRSFLSSDENLMVFSADSASTTIAMRLLGADRRAAAELLERQRGFSAYFRGSDPSRWRNHVPHYSKLRYRNVYPGIDLVYYGHGRALEYDFVVHPGSDPAKIRLAFGGATTRSLAGNGDLLLTTRLGEVRQRKPHIYQVVDGQRIVVEGAHRIEGETIAFSIEDYDRSRDLIVDPILEWSTYVGGVSDDEVAAITVAADQSVYVAGRTVSSDFPLINPLDSVFGFQEGFISKFIPDPGTGGLALAWSTYLGGSSFESVSALVTRPGGAIYVAGNTRSSDFPVLGQFQSQQVPVETDGFATKIQETSNQLSLVWSTYLGGSGEDLPSGIDVDGADNVYVAGTTDSVDFPTVIAFQSNQPGEDVFVTKFNRLTGPNLTVAYSTYLGGAGNEATRSLKVDSAGAVYIAGGTSSANFPTLSAVQPLLAGSFDGFVTKISARHVPAVTLDWSTYLGGTGFDAMNGLVVDPSGVFVAGDTVSPDFPVLHEYQGPQGGADVFVARLNQTSPLTLAWSTYYGGSEGDQANGIGIDRSGAVYVGGFTHSFDLPQFDSTQPFQGLADGFVARFVITAGGGPDLAGSTFVGGTSFDVGTALAVDAEAGIYLAGFTSSEDFPVLNEYSGDRGARDGFITKLHNDPIGILIASSPQGLAFTAAGPPGCDPGSYVTQTMLLMIPIPSTPCQVTFSSIYPVGTGSRHVFRQWSDPFLPAVPQITFSEFPTEFMTFTALYTTQHRLLTSVIPAGSGSIAPASGQFFDQGSIVQLTATASACFAFNAWSSNAPNGRVTMSAPQTVSARFVANSATALANVTITPGTMINLGGGRYRQAVKLVNSGPSVNDARLVINNLTAGFSVLNANGTTSCASPQGRPYLNAPAPLGSQVVTVEFFRLNASTPPTYTALVIAKGQP